MKAKNGKVAEVHALRIPPDLLARVRAKVKRTGKNKSQVLIAAITRGLGGVR